ncbi:FG-GAP repeat domain-containing protein [Pseudoxanthomonas yeongjuensis]|uniref:FG-GAP repeat domain-containing protein n=1 Tax=Pseudoxanthomonas yeongjuensis TaxID=377616 RepID=UPI001390818C|nr:VCBS repeat-containing protein [Pseudoxanthomonas yeongjuensis]
MGKRVTSWMFCILVATGPAGCGIQPAAEESRRETENPVVWSVQAHTARADRRPPSTGMMALSDSVKVTTSPSIAQWGFRPHRQYLHRTNLEVDPIGVGVAIYDDVVSGDFNGDGRTDLVALANQNFVDLILQTSSGTLAAPITFSAGVINYSTAKLIVVDDFNEDGIKDVAFDTVSDDGYRGGVGLLLSRAGQVPSFKQGYPALAYMSCDSPGDWTSLDVDGDGHKDIVVAGGCPEHLNASQGSCNSNYCLIYQVLHGDGRGNFGRPTYAIAEGLEGGMSEIMVEDVNRDGLLDLVFVGTESDPYAGSVRVAYRLPGGGLSPLHELHALLGNLTSETHIIFGDVDGDKRRDTVSGDEIHLRNADGTFGEALGLAMNFSYPITPFIADFNGDGLDDLVNHQFEDFDLIPYLAVYLGKGGDLNPPIRFYDPNPDWGHAFKVSYDRYPYAAGDFNQDGCLDLAIAVGYDGLAILDGVNCIPRPRRLTGGNLPPRRL